MEYVVVTPHIFRGERGEPLAKVPGDIVQVANRRIAKKLREQGTIKFNETSSGVHSLEKAESFTRTFRVGAFIHTSTFYSGGRIHLYQVLWTLAKMGAECYLITDNKPKWEKDYPKLKNLILVNNKDVQNAGTPTDLDLIFTDGKGGVGAVAAEWKRKHPFVPLVCLNFETPNWVAKYSPTSAGKMPEMKVCYELADLTLTNSAESMKWLKKYMEVKSLTGVLPPSANTFAVDTACENPIPEDMRDTPYVAWSARGSAYKGGNVIVGSILGYDKPLNLVMVGKPSHVPANTKLHKFIKFTAPISDAQKMLIFKGAVVVAAPSKFEGYGMVPGEAMCCGTPVVVYDLPVLRQEYGDRLIYAKWNNEKDFAKKLFETVENPPEVDAEEAKEKYGMGAMEKTITTLPYMNFKRKRVSAQMICYYGPTVQEAIESVYPHVDEVLISYGPTELWKDVPPDGSLELIKSFPDVDNKIKLIEKPVWRNKNEMRRACQKIMTGNYTLVVDADEIYFALDKWIENAPDYGCPRWVHFWHDINHYVIDSPGDCRWGKPHPLGGGTHNHYRWSYWRYSNEWSVSRGTVASDSKGTRLCSGFHTQLAVEASPETCIYHLGHVLTPKTMRAKHQFYLQRDGKDKGRIARMKAWHEWKGQLGNCGDGDICEVNWVVPHIVKRAFEKIGEEV